MAIQIDFTEHDAKKLLFGLIFGEVCLASIFVVESLLGKPVPEIHALLDLDGEANIPAWFSSIQLFMVGALLLLIRRGGNARYLPSRLFQRIVGLGFLFFSLDEVAMIHERITESLKHLQWIPHFKGGHGIWIPLYFTIGVVVSFAMYRDIRTMWRYFRRQTAIIVTGFTMYVAGAVVLETIGYEFLDAVPIKYIGGAEAVLEEFLEMSGVSVILYGVILYALRTTDATSDSGS